jgi:hypothetical protein
MYLVPHVVANRLLWSFEQERLKVFQETGEGDFLTYLLMQDMANKDIIPPGVYIIAVDVV